ncbi:hypothetical protein B0J12DRAFT_138692 [Macrophomina phaseolina]|uniref:Uncharacterized protein n=1 Tax=Macrophomina phaseolina TaxID=35725 RepID=A0ABQ8G9Q3_9PEZI|nr:hypothetical protein B0J12DRAFT_138692 [Macrophomina phaseolina]
MDDTDPALKAALAAKLDGLQFMLLTVLDREMIEDELTVLESGANATKHGPKNSAAPANAKRKRLEMCEQCDREFDVAANEFSACVWHPGSLRICCEDGFWCETGENMDTKENRDQFPEGFRWTCCSGQGDAEGCMAGFHQACASSEKKVRS